MFESTLESQGLNVGERRFGSMSVAVLAHFGVIAGIVAVSAIIVRPVNIPEPPKVFVIPVSPRDIVQPEKPHQEPPPDGGAERNRHDAVVQPVAPPIAHPESTPDVLPLIPREPIDDGVPGPDDETIGFHGDGSGGHDGPGRGDGDGDGDGSGTGHGSGEPQYITPDIDKPVLISKVEPEYPFAARRAGLGGRVTVSAIIGLDGGVESAEILASSNPIFDQAALTAVRQWRYRPATMNGRPVKVFFTVRVDFIVR